MSSEPSQPIMAHRETGPDTWWTAITEAVRQTMVSSRSL